jgi:hypothetical protein
MSFIPERELRFHLHVEVIIQVKLDEIKLSEESLKTFLIKGHLGSIIRAAQLYYQYKVT